MSDRPHNPAEDPNYSEFWRQPMPKGRPPEAYGNRRADRDRDIPSRGNDETHAHWMARRALHYRTLETQESNTTNNQEEDE